MNVVGLILVLIVGALGAVLILVGTAYLSYRVGAEKGRGKLGFILGLVLSWGGYLLTKRLPPSRGFTIKAAIAEEFRYSQLDKHDATIFAICDRCGSRQKTDLFGTDCIACPA
jgi:hypothetical protein